LWSLPDPMDVMVAFFDDDTPASSFARGAYTVASTSVDWKETPMEHVFKVDLPGLKKEEVTVQVEGDRTLSVAGQREKEEVQKTDTWHRVERSSGKFMRKFRLPDNTNLDRITAKVEDGVLTVVVPKMEKKKPEIRRIEIAGHHGQSEPEVAIHSEEQTITNGIGALMQTGPINATSADPQGAVSGEQK
jgi:HSP20 family protein